MNFNLKNIFKGVIALLVLFLGCIQKPVSMDIFQPSFESQTSFPLLEQIMVDTSGTYWGARDQWLFLLSIDNDKNLTVLDSMNISGSYIDLVQNPVGLIIVQSRSELLYAKSIENKIVIFNKTMYLSDGNSSGITDESGVLWFLSYTNYNHLLLYKWNGTSLDSLDIGKYVVYYRDLKIAINSQMITFMVMNYEDMEKVTRFDYDKKGTLTKKEYSIVSGKFKILDLMYFDTTLYVALGDYYNACVRYDDGLYNPTIFLQDRKCITKAVDSTFLIKLFLEDRYSQGNKIYQAPDIFWMINNQYIGKFTASAVSEITSEKEIDTGVFFTKKNGLYGYSYQSGKVFRIDDQKGFVDKLY